MRMRRLWMVDPVWDPVSIRLYFWMFPPAPAFDSCPSVADAVAVLIDVNEIVMRWRGGRWEGPRGGLVSCQKQPASSLADWLTFSFPCIFSF